MKPIYELFPTRITHNWVSCKDLVFQVYFNIRFLQHPFPSTSIVLVPKTEICLGTAGYQKSQIWSSSEIWVPLGTLVEFSAISPTEPKRNPWLGWGAREYHLECVFRLDIFFDFLTDRLRYHLGTNWLPLIEICLGK
jgi:hypothetical protein